ncbi:MAG: hypothetical protein ABL974_13845 [Prosthecobacter sp.]
MADTTQKQTAATGATPGQKPAGAASKPSPVTTPGKGTSFSEQDLDSMLEGELGTTIEEPDAELDADLPVRKSKKDKQASTPKAGDEEETEAEDETEESAESEEEESESEEAEEVTETEDTETEEAEIGDDEEVDAEKPPKGFEKVPKGIWKRQNKLIQTQRDLKAQLAKGAIQVTPTEASPLADVDTLEALESRLTTAKSVRTWFKANPDGGSFTLSNGKTFELDQAAAAAHAAKADTILESAPDIKLRLMQREKSKPWEQAQKLVPTLFDKTSPDHAFLTEVFSKAPGLADHPEWELIMAYAARGQKEFEEESSKKARYVRYELDKDGKMIPPKSKSGDGKQEAGKPAQKPAPRIPPATPGTAKPTLKAINKAPDKRPAAKPETDSDLARMLTEELGD